MNKFILMTIISLSILAVACGETETVEVEVVKEVPVEVVKEVEVEVIKEVEVVKEVEVIKEVVAPAEIKKPLVIYSGRSESLVAPIIAQFSEATGIEVEVKYGKTGALAATLLEEGSKTPADIYFAQDPGGLGSVESMLAPISDEIVNLTPDWADSPTNKWVGISGRARVVVYNLDAISDPSTQLPDNIYDFIDPKWKGKIGWAPTNGSFQAMVTGMRIIWGEEKTKTWLEGIVANEAKVYAKNTPTVEATGAGEVEVGFVNHYYLHRFIAENTESFRARNYMLPSGGPGSIVLVAGAGMLEASDNKDGAEAFLKFMLSGPAQGFFANQTYEYPLVEGVNKSHLLPDLSALNTPDIDISDLGDLAATQKLLQETGALP
jgi:iron(III) transport system substrate-binding protein